MRNMSPPKQPVPDWLKIRIRLRPDQYRQFRKFLKLIHKIQKRHASIQ